jgi:hypothetical protein
MHEERVQTLLGAQPLRSFHEPPLGCFGEFRLHGTECSGSLPALLGPGPFREIG